MTYIHILLSPDKSNLYLKGLSSTRCKYKRHISLHVQSHSLVKNGNVVLEKKTDDARRTMTDAKV